MPVHGRLTRVKCPICGGSGLNRLRIACWPCEGTGKATFQGLTSYSSVVQSLARSGYVCGDLSFEDRTQMLTEAARCDDLALALAEGRWNEETWLKARDACER